MLQIDSFTLNGLENNIITDDDLIFSFSLKSDVNNTKLTKAVLTFSDGNKLETTSQVNIIYSINKLKPHTEYKVKLQAFDNYGNEAVKELIFKTGRMKTPFIAKWISDSSYTFKEKGVSPKVMEFKKDIKIKSNIKSALIEITALGMYKLFINGLKASEDFFAPGFTSYKNNLQYQTYDIKDLLKEGNNNLIVDVAGGWCVGSFVMNRVNRVYAKRQALLFQLEIEYENGEKETILSDENTEVSTSTPFIMADLYDGETYSFRQETINYHKASMEKLKFKPNIIADYSSKVHVLKTLKPEFIREISGVYIYDFKQNFAGVIKLKVKNANGDEKIIIHHAEVLNSDGSLNLSLLRTAKATATIYSKKGNFTYTPTFTYMGFRYISIEGIDINKVEVEGLLLSSLDLTRSTFKCDNPLLNRLNENIEYSSYSNFMDIPTDCPQRDERMGWTGDISIFASTACYNFQIDRFLRKWLRDVKKEQLKTGGIPNTVPVHGYGFPITMPKMAIDFWGDAICNVPYALYKAYGDKAILGEMYESMKKYVNACKFWANLFSIGKHRYIWHTPSLFHFGDWVSPDVDKMSAWQKRSKYTATASLYYTSSLVAKIADILNKRNDKEHYEKIAKKTKEAYSSILLGNKGKIKKDEFQTGYVLPIAFNMLEEEEKEKALNNLISLIEKNDYKIGTGFPGTPYILFALADNNKSEIAYKMLLNTEAPSWLYAIKAGGTTIWEKFDGMNLDGTAKKSSDGTDNMISFNHYASGSVGRFLYTRLAGLRILKPGYKEFEINPIFTNEIKEVETSTITPYGRIYLKYKHDNKKGTIDIEVPVSTTCQLNIGTLKKTINSGIYTFNFNL